MVAEARRNIPIRIELSGALGPLAHDPTIEEAANGIVSDVRALIEDLGLHGEPSVEVTEGDATRAVRIWTSGILQPYTPDLMQLVWGTVAPGNLKEIAEDTAANPTHDFPDDWLQSFVAGSEGSTRGLEGGLIGTFLRRLVLEIIRDHPRCLVGLEQAASYLADSGGGPEQSSPAVSPDFLRPVLASLLDLGLSLTDRAAVLQSVQLSYAIGRSVEDTTEGVFRRLRPGRLEIHVHPGYLAHLLNGVRFTEPASVYAESIGEGLRESFRRLEAALLIDLGIFLPELVWVPSPELIEGAIGVKINDRLGLFHQGLRPDELFVAERLTRMKQRGILGRRVRHPITRKEGTVISASSREAVEQSGAPFWDPHGFAILLLFAEISRRARQLLSIDEAEYQIGLLEAAFPELVQEALSRFSLGDLARTLRGLVDEGLSTRDMRGILERMVQFDTIPIDPGDLLVLDERLPVSIDRTAESLGWPDYLAFLRKGLKPAITQKYCQGRDLLIAYRTDPQVEARVMAVQRARSTTGDSRAEPPFELQDSMDAVWAGVQRATIGDLLPVVLTGTHARAAIRSFIGDELPGVPVLAVSEVQRDIDVYQVNGEGSRMEARVAVTKDNVERTLTILLGSSPLMDADGDFAFKYGSKRVFIRVNTHNESTVVFVYAMTNREIPPSNDLYHWVATHTDDWVFGHIVMTESKDGVGLAFRHTLLGDFLDPEELVVAVATVGTTADEIAGRVKQQFGGKLSDEA